MGRQFLEHLGGRHYYSCEQCNTYLTNKREIISPNFRGATGAAYLFRHVVNVRFSELEARQMLTGKHLVRDVFCKKCCSKLGWMYEFAYESAQTYKEGYVILEKRQMLETEEPNESLAERMRPNGTITRNSSTSSMSSSGISSVTPVTTNVMTILPKKKAHPPNKNERYSRGSASANAEHPQHRYGGASPASHSGIDVTSGAMRTSGVLPAGSSSASGVAPGTISAAAKRVHRKYSTTPVVQSSASTSASCAASADLSISTCSGPPTSQHGKLVGRQTPSTSKHSSCKSSTASVAKKVESTNSDDEYGEGFRDDELEIRFAECLKKTRGFIIKDVKGDGACMFRAVADQVYGDEEMHSEVRILCMDYIAKNRDHFSQFLTEDFDDYLERKRENDAHGNHVELQAISEIYLRPIEIYEYSMEPINTFHPISPEANTGVMNAPLRLSYHGNVHYNSVDPFRATIGVGLGLPNYQPGLADRNLLEQAQLASEAQHIEEAMLNDKLRMTDWERTEDELSRQIAKESYMEYLRQQEKGLCRSDNSLHLKQTVIRNQEAAVDSSFSKSDPISGWSKGRATVVVGTKRGVSAPDVSRGSPGRAVNRKASENCDRQNGSLSPQAKIYRDERAASSMPNIDKTSFGASFYNTHKDSVMKPSTSAASLAKATISSQNVALQQSKVAEHAPSSSSAVVVEKAKSDETSIVEGTTDTKGPSLYEELLAASAMASDDWAGSMATFDETAEIARVLALSQQEFYESMTRRQ